MFGVGPMEMMVVGIIALLLFGKNLPQVARSVGKGMMEFKKGLAGIDDDIYNASNRSSSSSTPQSRPLPSEERDEATAPKFDPPKYEPTPVDPDQPA